MIMERVQNSALSVRSFVRAGKYLQTCFAMARGSCEELTFEVSKTNPS